ncbi:MAG: hypothetical protein Q8755_03330, partial [Candidatus Phytoplasma australasiaticum]|nr:hypothetical protein [Candidatus Phytoplasma australasiaticum]
SKQLSSFPLNKHLAVFGSFFPPKRFKKTCYELLIKRKPNLEWLEPFGAPCTIMSDPDNKLAAKAEEGILLGYSTPNKRVWNLKTQRI